MTIGSLETFIARDLASRYCPHSTAVFTMRSWGLFALLLVVALGLFVAAYRSRSRRGRAPAYLAVALLLFSVGSLALVLYGVSGCSGAAAEGLIRDWP